MRRFTYQHIVSRWHISPVDPISDLHRRAPSLYLSQPHKHSAPEHSQFLAPLLGMHCQRSCEIRTLTMPSSEKNLKRIYFRKLCDFSNVYSMFLSVDRALG